MSAPLPSVGTALASLARNRAFVTLAAAMIAMIVAATVFERSVLYYFKYALGDESAGRFALAAMMGISLVAVPAWMAVSSVIGARATWFVATGLCFSSITAFVGLDVSGIRTTQTYLIGLQAGIVGLHFTLWALLPDTIEYGQRATGVRVEAMLYGMVALLQRVAIGVATAIFGFGIGSAGYVADAAPSASVLATMRLTIALVPLGFFVLSATLMIANPLRKGEHARVLGDLARRRRA